MKFRKYLKSAEGSLDNNLRGQISLNAGVRDGQRGHFSTDQHVVLYRGSQQQDRQSVEFKRDIRSAFS